MGLMRPLRRTLVYVEGDATMSQYNDAEGKPRSALNLVQRKSIALTHACGHEYLTNRFYLAEKLEVLSPKKPAA